MNEFPTRRVAQGDSRTPGGVHLLDVDPDLGSSLDPVELAEVRQHLILPAVTLEPGPFRIASLRDARGVRGALLGFLVLEGAITTEVQIARGQPCLRLITAGELVLLDGQESDSIPTVWRWSTLQRARLALLDDRLLIVGRRWPRLLAAVLRRGAEQTRHGLLQQAVGQLPRVEDRLLMLLWSIADRRGTVRADGVRVDLPLTQETLARMIGARRPTVSLGLKRLVDSGLISTASGGWVLAHDSVHEFVDGSGARRRAVADGAACG